ncbi:hypothetical protein, partial [Acidithiobacillus thiooxidans]|uniref:hypothetical protein n=1 Tax=Acidithiobacillus thiooxidans TaxID=930 RepID=UPI001A7E1339
RRYHLTSESRKHRFRAAADNRKVETYFSILKFPFEIPFHFSEGHIQACAFLIYRTQTHKLPLELSLHGL